MITACWQDFQLLGISLKRINTSPIEVTNHKMSLQKKTQESKVKMLQRNYAKGERCIITGRIHQILLNYEPQQEGSRDSNTENS